MKTDLSKVSKPFRRRRSIAWQLGLFFCLLLIATGMSLSWSGYQVARRIIRDQIHERLKRTAIDSTERVREYVDRQRERVALVASRTRLRVLVDEYLRGERDAASMRERTENILRDALASTRDFRTIWFVGNDGKVLTSTDASYDAVEFGNNRAFLQCRDNTGETAYHLSEPFAQDGKLFAYLAAPATIREGDKLGVVLILLDVEPLRSIIQGSRSEDGLAETGELLIARQDGEQLRYLLPIRSNARNVDPDEAPGMMAAIQGHRGFEMATYEGVPVLLYHLPMPFQPGYQTWGLVAKMDTADAYKPLQRLRRTLVIVQFGLLSFGLLATFGLSRWLTRPIQQLTAAADAFAAGDLHTRVEVNRTDELGGLATTFNQMAANLHELNTRLERKVDERTAELEAARDVAELANRELEAKTEELKRSNTDLQQFAYVASHDLQEPLRAVSGFSELLQQQYAAQLDEKANTYIDFAVDGTKRMQALIDDLLRYSRVGSAGDEFTPVNCEDAVRDALKNLKSAIESSKAEILAGNLPTVAGDKSQLVRVFQNLIGNAIKFRAEASPKIEIAAEQTDGEWQFTIRDNGIGIKQEYAERIFVIFQRLHSRTDYAGTGIGLAVCQRIIQRHGGRIWVESEEGSGSTFFFTIPVQ